MRAYLVAVAATSATVLSLASDGWAADTCTCGSPGSLIASTTDATVAVSGTGSSASGVHGDNSAGTLPGVLGTNGSAPGTATYACGVEGYVDGTSYAGVYGINVGSGAWGGTIGNGAGVFGTTSVSTSAGVVGTATGTSGSGVLGYNGQTGPSVGVTGLTTGTSGGCIGVEALTSDSSGEGLIATNGTVTLPSGCPGSAICAISSVGAGLYVGSTGGNAITAVAPVNVQIPSSNSTYPLYGLANYTGGTTYGVVGQSPNSNSAAAGIGGFGDTGGAFYGVATGLYATCSGTNCDAAYFNDQVYVSGNATITGSASVHNLSISGTCTGSTCTSDIRLKRNVQSLSGSLDVLSRLRPVSFEWKEPGRDGHTSGTQVGFIAQEVEKVKPEWVSVNDDGYKTIDNTRLPVMLVDSVRTLKMENDDLRLRSANQEDRIKSLEAGRRPLVSGLGEGGIGFGLCAIAGALIVTRRKRPEERV